MTTSLAPKNGKKSTPRTRLIPGILLIVAGLAIILLFGLNMQPGLHSTFGLTPQGIPTSSPSRTWFCQPRPPSTCWRW